MWQILGRYHWVVWVGFTEIQQLISGRFGVDFGHIWLKSPPYWFGENFGWISLIFHLLSTGFIWSKLRLGLSPSDKFPTQYTIQCAPTERKMTHARSVWCINYFSLITSLKVNISSNKVGIWGCKLWLISTEFNINKCKSGLTYISR